MLRKIKAGYGARELLKPVLESWLFLIESSTKTPKKRGHLSRDFKKVRKKSQKNMVEVTQNWSNFVVVQKSLWIMWLK